METAQKRYRAFENSVDAQVLVPGINADFNDYILSQTVIPVNKIGPNVAIDPYRMVEMLLHSYDATPGNYILSNHKRQFRV